MGAVNPFPNWYAALIGEATKSQQRRREWLTMTLWTSQ